MSQFAECHFVVSQFGECHFAVSHFAELVPLCRVPVCQLQFTMCFFALFVCCMAVCRMQFVMCFLVESHFTVYQFYKRSLLIASFPSVSLLSASLPSVNLPSAIFAASQFAGCQFTGHIVRSPSREGKHTRTA